jgi:hypothetical protein
MIVIVLLGRRQIQISSKLEVSPQLRVLALSLSPSLSINSFGSATLLPCSDRQPRYMYSTGPALLYCIPQQQLLRTGIARLARSTPFGLTWEGFRWISQAARRPFARSLLTLNFAAASPAAPDCPGRSAFWPLLPHDRASAQPSGDPPTASRTTIH